jgi:hypothetical protein
MATGSTPIYNIPYPLSTDLVQVHTDLESMATSLETLFGLFNVSLSFPNTWTNSNIFESNTTTPTVKITQSGTGHALLVEDEASDTSPFIIDNAGNVIIGKTTSATAKLDVVGNAVFSGTVTASSFSGTTYIGTTSVALNRSSANQGLTGISSIALPGSTSGTITLSPAAVAGTTSLTLPSISGTLAVNPMTTAGDIVYGGVSGTPTRLGAGTNGQYLSYNATSGAPEWVTPTTGYTQPTIGSTPIPSGTTVTGISGLTLTSPTIILNTSSSTNSGRISWDNTNNTLLVGDGTTTRTFRSFTVNQTAKTGAYTLTLSDADTLLQMNGAYAFTIPLNSSVAYPVGTQISFVALSNGVSIALASGVTGVYSPGLKLRALGSVVSAIKIATDTWAISGDLSV